MVLAASKSPVRIPPRFEGERWIPLQLSIIRYYSRSLASIPISFVSIASIPKFVRLSVYQSLERESNRSDSKMRARHLLSCLTDGEILILLSSQSVELVHGMLSTYFCILLPKSNWSLLLSYSPAGLSVPARGGLVDERTARRMK